MAAQGITGRGLGIGWRLSTAYGWGVFGLNLAYVCLRRGVRPVLLRAGSSVEIDPLRAAALGSVVPHSDSVARRIAAATAAHPEPFDGPVLEGLANDLDAPDALAIAGTRRIGFGFLESTAVSAGGRERARRYETIAVGCRWNEAFLRAAGVANVQTVFQGIDPSLFHPAPRCGLFGPRFLVYSGGKLEYRKGQDLVIAAFRAFRMRRPDALLLTQWGSPWPGLARSLALSRHLRAPPAVGADDRLDVGAWLAAEGLPPGSVLVLPPMANGAHATVLREADVALLPSRAEGGTNLVAMEALACGVPTILSDNTGHRDLIADLPCRVARCQAPVPAWAPGIGTEGWGESDVEELVELLDAVWLDRAGARAEAEAAAAAMAARWTWDTQLTPLFAAAFD